jgi:RNA polymerase sigma-70 factor, ECF subfamily
VTSSAEPAAADPAAALLAIYDEALPEVYGYLLRRLSSGVLAEELCADTFHAALSSLQRGKVHTVTVAWLIGIARHRLVDHWRSEGRRQRVLSAVAGDLEVVADPWATEIEEAKARAVLAQLTPDYRMVLTLRYLDGLAVPRVAADIGRSVHATESLLMRAKAAFRQVYESARGSTSDSTSGEAS